MKNIWCIFLLNLFTLMLHAQSYDHLWRQVQEASTQDLPRQALEYVQTIHTKALRESDDVQLLKAHLALIQYNYEISTDSILPFTRAMISAMERERRPLQNSLWHSALAQVYENNLRAFMLQGQSYDEVKAQALVHYEASLAEPELLMAMSYKSFLPLFDEHKDSHYFNDDCLHVLYHTYLKSDFISQRDKKKCIARIRDVYQRFKNYNAVVLLSLDSLDYSPITTNVHGRIENNSYYKQLKNIYTQYSRQPASLYAVMRMAGLYRSSYTDKSAEEYDMELNNRNDSILYSWTEKALYNPLYDKDKDGLSYLTKLRNEFNAPSVFIPGLQRDYYPSDDVTLSVTNRNVEMLTFRIIPCYGDCVDYDQATVEQRRRIVRRHRNIGKIYEYMPIGTPRRWGKFTLNMRVPETPGIYELEVLVNNQKVESRTFHVTALAPLAFSVNRHQHRLLVVDRQTGHPVNGAHVRAYDRSGNRFCGKYKTTDGELVIDRPVKPDYISYYVNTSTDLASSPWHSHPGYGYYMSDENRNRTVVDLFTDRAIYRPGQTVFFSGVSYAKNGDDFQSDTTLTGIVRCLNVNRHCMDSLKVHTDAFGTFHGTFRLPEEGMNGCFQLIFSTAGHVMSRHTFRVEEYQRPTLQVRFLDASERYRLNDSVTVTGVAQTFTGIPVAGASVTYTVRHTTWWNRVDESDLQTGELLTDAEGNFSFRIRLTASDEPLWYRGYNCHFFQVGCTVTADNGETAQAETVYRAETRRAYLQTNLPEVLCKEYIPDCQVNLLNAAGDDLRDSIRCELWRDSTLVQTDYILAGKSFCPSSWRSVSSGRYSLVLHVDDEIEDLRKDISLFSIQDQNIPDTSTPFFTYKHLSTGGDSVIAFVGTSSPDAILYYNLVAGDSLLDSRRISLDQRLHCLRLAYRSEYGDAATASLALVHHNRLHTFSYSVRKPMPDKRLSLSWTSFRSRLTPGQQEEWRLRITRPDGTPAQASLLACLYDASLDQLATCNWKFSAVNILRQLPRADWNRQGFWVPDGIAIQGSLGNQQPLYPPAPALTGWKESLLNYYHPYYFRSEGHPLRKNMLRATGAVMEKCDEVAYDAAEPMVNLAVSDKTSGPSTENGSVPVQVRSNFAETAFFQPSLLTDTLGEVSLSFTLPESMTQWNFKALAHDSHMNYGSLQANIVARKPFMVQPAMPRFVRQGDRTLLPVTVTNLTQQSVRCNLVLALFHGVHTDSLLRQFIQPVTLQAGQHEVVSFEFPVCFDTPSIICRIIARSESFSDGEEHLLPVLGDQVEVCRTIPFSLRQTGKFEVRIPDWLQRDNISHPVLGVELTSSPLWYTLSALPVMAARQHNLTANDWATVFYASALGQRVAELNPALQRTIERQSGELEKAFQPRWNAIDDSTPWLDRTQNEARRVRELCDLLGDSLSEKRMQQALSQLRSLQKSDGGWSWCPGMHSNVWTTVDVSLLLARSQQLAKNYKGKEMLRRAYNYLRNRMSESVDDMKRWEKKYNEKVPVTETHLRYLYLTVILGEEPHGDDLFLLDRAAQLRKELTMYGKALAARVLAETGYGAESQMALQSLLEHTTLTEENGRFFDTSRALPDYSSYRIPTQCATIETLQYFGRHAEAEEMMLWLLQAKRTQMWDTPRASTDAVYTLLAGGGPRYPLTLLTEKTPLRYTLRQGAHVLAEVPKDSLDTRCTTGYIRETYTDSSSVCADCIEITKPSEGLSWGTVYATFRQPEDQVVKSGSGFDLTYTLEVFDQGKWSKFRFGKPLRKGMRVRRTYMLKADRDYDFVKLRADRPACFIPAHALSGYAYFDRFAAYRMVRDAATEFYIEHLSKGTYRFTEDFFVDRSGNYATGISRISCLQAPEFTAVTPSIWLYVE